MKIFIWLAFALFFKTLEIISDVSDFGIIFMTCVIAAAVEMIAKDFEKDIKQPAK